MLVILNNLKHCQVVDLSGNNLILDSQDIFIKSGLNMLQNTILSNCSITTLHPRTFAGLHSLNHLDLSNNLLVQFPAHIFQFIPQIGSLTLAGNSLSTIKQRHFLNLHGLHTLDLSNCSICYINNPPFLLIYHFSGRVNNRRAQLVGYLLDQKNGK